MKNYLSVRITILCAVFLVSCHTAPATQPQSLFPGEELVPFATNTSTPTVTSTPVNAPTATLAPTITLTPTVYTIKANETLWEIAANYNLSVDQLRAANPTINPNLLSAGTVIIIPAANGSGETATQSAPASGFAGTVYPLSVGEVTCTPSQSGGLYCFGEIINDQEFMAGNITAEFRLTNAESGEVLTQRALVPLNRIATGGHLPLFAYFPAPAMSTPVAILQLQTAMSVNQNGSPTPLQAANVRVDNPEVNISANGLSVIINAQAVLDAADEVSGKVWIAVVAYDAQNAIVGIRRFVSTNTLNPGESVSFSLNIYSIGGKISRVEFFGEINP